MTQIALPLLWIVAADWQPAPDIDGFSVEKRRLQGSQYDELRVSVRSPLPPERVFAVLWNIAEYPRFAPYVKSLTVLKDGDEKVAHVMVRMPVIKDRDYTMGYKKAVDKQTRVHQMFFKIANHLGPPPTPDHVRIQDLFGSYTVEPTDDGGCDLTYQVYSDPAGVVPAFVVNAGQAQASVKFVRAILERAAKPL